MTTSLPILPITDPRLKRPAARIEHPTLPEWRALAATMAVTMLDHDGCGLAAPQVGHDAQMLVMLDVDGDQPSAVAMRDAKIITMINPVITQRFGDLVTRTEGCLSMPGVFVEVARHQSVSVEFTDLSGGFVRRDYHGHGAVCVQHEVDHLNGVRMIDCVSRLRRDKAMRLYAKKTLWLA
jgi:peptide deformylase